MKLCINCVHFYTPMEVRIEAGKQVVGLRKAEYALCKRVERPRSLVTGLHEGDPYPYCSVARETPCGESARFYEEKDIPVTQEEEEAFQEMDNTCKVCKQDQMEYKPTRGYFKCGTCGNTHKPEPEEL